MVLPSTRNVWLAIPCPCAVRKTNMMGSVVNRKVNREIYSSEMLRGPAVNEQMTVFGSMTPNLVARNMWQLPRLNNLKCPNRHLVSTTSSRLIGASTVDIISLSTQFSTDLTACAPWTLCDTTVILRMSGRWKGGNRL